jgi:hypothetical protein
MRVDGMVPDFAALNPGYTCYDLWHAECALRKVVAKIPTAKAKAA